MEMNPLFIIDIFLLVGTFLGLGISMGTISATQQDDFRAAIAFDVASFIFFFIATSAVLCFFWLRTALDQLNYKPGFLLAGFLWFLGTLTAPVCTYCGLMSLVITVGCVIQAILGTVAHADDTLTTVIVSFLGTTGFVVTIMMATTVVLTFSIPFGGGRERKSEKEGNDSDRNQSGV
jgi:hypothetical protein